MTVCRIFLRGAHGWKADGKVPTSCASLSPWADWGSALEIIDCLSARPTHSCVCMPGCRDQMLGIALEVCFPLLCTDMPSTMPLRLYKLIEIRKNGESKTVKKNFFGGGGRVKNNNKNSLNISHPPLDTEEFAPCFICFPSVLRCIIHRRPTLLHTDVAALQHDRLSSGGKSSRRDLPIWTAISAGRHSSPRVRFGIGKPPIAS